MPEFLKGNHLNSKLDLILEKAEQKLFLISPFIKFHERIKEVLLTKKYNDKLSIMVVFGKNENNKERSFGEKDFYFLAQFPNITIRYEPRLHAKYYANEGASLLSSMNLYGYSQNNNIEFGIYAETGIFDGVLKAKTIDSEAWDYFGNVIENSKLMFKKTPIYEEKYLGLTKKYVRSEIEVDELTELFNDVENKKSSKNKTVQKKEKLVSATVLGKPFEKTYKEVVNFMTDNGFIKDNEITSLGKELGLQTKTNPKGDSWIVYPESLSQRFSNKNGANIL